MGYTNYREFRLVVHALDGWGKHIFLIVSFLKIPAVSLALRALKQKGKKGVWGKESRAVARDKLLPFCN